VWTCTCHFVRMIRMYGSLWLSYAPLEAYSHGLEGVGVGVLVSGGPITTVSIICAAVAVIAA
jgi:hypothetical protein